MIKIQVLACLYAWRAFGLWSVFDELSLASAALLRYESLPVNYETAEEEDCDEVVVENTPTTVADSEEIHGTPLELEVVPTNTTMLTPEGIPCDVYEMKGGTPDVKVGDPVVVKVPPSNIPHGNDTNRYQTGSSSYEIECTADGSHVAVKVPLEPCPEISLDGSLVESRESESTFGPVYTELAVIEEEVEANTKMPAEIIANKEEAAPEMPAEINANEEKAAPEAPIGATVDTFRSELLN